MIDKYLNMLKIQVKKLDQKDFDLEAWKSSAISLLSKIFGDEDGKVKEINNLKIDYGSWALRDAKASYNPLETCKKKGKEILESSISELKNFGFPQRSKVIAQNILTPILENELKVSQYKALKEILEGKGNDEEKIASLTKKFQSYSKDLSSKLIATYLVKSGMQI